MFKNFLLRRYPAGPNVLFLFLTTLFIRLPFFFRDYTDRDESTFILMGQSIADGHLPYVHLWDLKPPLLFYIFGAIETLFPHSFIAIRFFGVLVVFISAIFLDKIAKKGGLHNGLFIALLYIIFSSEIGNLQGLMSEHLAVLFFLPGLFFLQERRNGFYFLIAGLFFGCALLCKLSYAYAVVALIISFLLLNWKSSSRRELFTSNLLLGFGLLLPFFLISIPFLAQQQADIFINSVFLAPLEYGHAQQYTFLQKIAKTWWIISPALLLSFLAMKKSSPGNKELISIASAVLLGTVYTFFSSGIVNGHYLILIFPFVFILLSAIISKREVAVRLRYLALFVILISVESLIEYYRVAKSYTETGTSYYRPSFQIVNELKRLGLDKKKIFFADYHIGYWLLQQYPLSKSTTHPTNLGRPYLFKYFNVNKTSMEELKYLMEEVRPDIVVSKIDRLGFFSYNGEENSYFRSIISEKFKVLKQDNSNKIFIWQRIDSSKK